jgi:YggT family protein
MPKGVGAVPPVVLVINIAVTLLIFVLVLRIILANAAVLLGRERLPALLGTITDYVVDVTEPLLAPLRRVLPNVGLTLDFSPLVAIIVIDLLARLLTLVLLRVM